MPRLPARAAGRTVFPRGRHRGNVSSKARRTGTGCRATSSWRILDEVAEWPAVDISFDDGNASDVEIALPALQERRLFGTFYTLAGRLDHPGCAGCGRPTGVERGRNGGRHARLAPRAVDRPGRLVLPSGGLAGPVVPLGGHRRPVTKAALPFGRYDRRGYCASCGRRHTSAFRRATALWPGPTTGSVARFSVHATDSAESIRAVVNSAATRPRARALTSMKGAVEAEPVTRTPSRHGATRDRPVLGAGEG